MRVEVKDAAIKSSHHKDCWVFTLQKKKKKYTHQLSLDSNVWFKDHSQVLKKLEPGYPYVWKLCIQKYIWTAFLNKKVNWTSKDSCKLVLKGLCTEGM